MAVIVMGVSGCGKSTVGALLADTLGCDFLEGDDFHEPAAVTKMRQGISLTDDDRWPWLDRIGEKAAARLREHGQVVVACSALRRAYRDRLRAAIGANIRFIMLDNSREVIRRRMMRRPNHYMPASLLDSQFDTLERPAMDEPARIIRSDVPPQTMRDRALQWLGSPVSA